MWKEYESIYGNQITKKIKKKYFPMEETIMEGIEEQQKYMLNKMKKNGELEKYKNLEGKIEWVTICYLVKMDIIRQFLDVSWASIIRTWIGDFIQWAEEDDNDYEVNELRKIVTLYHSTNCPTFIKPKRLNSNFLKRKFKLQELKCEKCGVIKPLEIHHIIPISEGGTDDKINLQILCKNCHWLIHHNN